MKIVLIDADIVAWRIALQHETAIEFDEGLFTWWADMNQAKPDIEYFIEGLLNDTNCDDLVVCLSDASNFRKKLQPSYKQNRKDRYTPLLVQPVREYMEKNWKSVCWKDLEADDVMGILATTEDENIYTIATIDKDLQQIPALHFNWDKPEQGISETTEEMGERFLYRQILSGDPTDGYPGCKGFGPVKAQRTVEKYWPKGLPTLWEGIISAYESQHQCSRTQASNLAINTARCAKILQNRDYDSKTGIINLWEPPNGQ